MWRQSVSGKPAGEDGRGEPGSGMSKGGKVDSSFSERPGHYGRGDSRTGSIRRGRGRFTRSSTRYTSGRTWRSRGIASGPTRGPEGLTVKASRYLARSSKSV